MVMCFAPTCKHYSEKSTCRFFVFPKEKKELANWIKLIRRQDRAPTQSSRICSCHFLDGNRINGPTLFNYNIGKQIPLDELHSAKKRKKLAVLSKNDDFQPQPGPSWLLDDPQTEPSSSKVAELAQDEEPECEDDIADKPTEVAQTSNFNAMLESENYFLRQEIDNLTTRLNKLSIQFSFAHIEKNDHLINIYTGIPSKDIFLCLFSLFENLDFSYVRGWQVIRITLIDQLLLTLMKLRLNLHNEDLALRFHVSRETVANIFKTWLYALHRIIYKQLMKTIPSRNKNKLCMPSSFTPFSNCRIIVDCTEITTIHPTSMEKQKLTYSHYKHRNTLKGLIAVAPNGVITFASSLYPGSISDKKITSHCGILEKLEAGDMVMADKGFLIADILPEGVSLNIPPFLTTPQFSEQQIILTKKIAKARIHVERAINRVKCFQILRNIPSPLISDSSIIFQVCCALTNFHFPLIKEVETKFNY